MSKSPVKDRVQPEEPLSRRTEKLIFGACAVLIVVHLFASFFPAARLWGINLLYYFPLGLRLLLCAIGLIVLIPKLNGALTSRLTRAFGWIGERSGKMNRYLKYSVASVISLVVFWIFRSATPLLGDGYLRAGELKYGTLMSLTEPLDFFLHLAVFRLFGLDGQTTFAVLSCVAGGIFVFLVFLFGDLWGKDGEEKLLISSILLSMGAIQLFFGYIESYAFMYLCLAAYLLFALRYSKGQGSFLWPCLFLFLASGFHLSALVLLPSLFYLAFGGSPGTSRTKFGSVKFINGMYLGGTILVIALGLYLLTTYAPEEPPESILIHPFGGGDSFYSFFSLEHWSDFLNHQLLISPVGAALVVLFLVFFRKIIQLKEKAARFLLWVVGFSFLYAAFVDPKLGYARDWDLFAFTGLGVTLLALFLLLQVMRGEKVMEVGGLALALVMTCVVSTLPWVLINASEGKAVARLEYLLRMDKGRAAHGYETLACYFRDRGDHDKPVELWKKAIATNPNPRYFASLGNAYRRVEDYDEAIEAYYRCLEFGKDFPSLPGVYSNLGNTLARLGRYDEAVSHVKMAISMRPDKADYHFNLGNILGKAGRYDEAVPYFETAIKLDPDNVRAYKVLGWTYARIGDNERAKSCLEQYLRFKPKDGPQIKGLIDSIQIEIESGR